MSIKDKLSNSWFRRLFKKKEKEKLKNQTKESGELKSNLDQMKMRPIKGVPIPVLDPSTILTKNDAEIKKRKEIP